MLWAGEAARFGLDRRCLALKNWRPEGDSLGDARAGASIGRKWNQEAEHDSRELLTVGGSTMGTGGFSCSSWKDATRLCVCSGTGREVNSCCTAWPGRRGIGRTTGTGRGGELENCVAAAASFFGE